MRKFERWTNLIIEATNFFCSDASTFLTEWNFPYAKNNI